MLHGPTDQTQRSGRKAFGDASFSIAERIISQICQLSIFVVAARTLGPAEFGVFALVSAFAILLLRLAEAGWAPFIMSNSDNDAVPFQVLLVAIASGIVFGFIGGLGTLAAGAMGFATDTVVLSGLFAFWVVIANASSAQKGVLIWMGRMRGSAVCEISGEIVGLIVSLVALFSDAGVFALAYGRLSCQTTVLALSFCVTRRAPMIGISGAVLHQLWVFSLQMLSVRMVGHFRVHFVTFVIGAYLGPAAVGFYRAAERLVGALSELIVVPGQLLAWMHLRAARDSGGVEGQTDRINAEVGRHLKVLLVFGAPLLLWLMLMNDELVSGLLGEKWLPAARLVAILAFARLIFLPGILAEPLMSIVDEARRLPGFVAKIFVVAISVTFVAVHFGVLVIAWAQIFVSVYSVLATGFLLARYAGIRWKEIVGTLSGSVPPLVCGVLTIMLLNWAAEGKAVPDLVEAVSIGLVGLAVYVVGIVILDRPFSRPIIEMFRRGAVAP